jgi:hypothetical protein
MKDLHSWVQPLLIVPSRIIELLELLLKHGENATGQIAGFEPVGERVREKILPGAPFVHFQGLIENQLEVGQCGSTVSVKHKGESCGWSWVMGKEKSDTPQTCRYSIFITDGRRAIDRRARHTTVQRGLGRRQKKGFNY